MNFFSIRYITVVFKLIFIFCFFCYQQHNRIYNVFFLTFESFKALNQMAQDFVADTFTFFSSIFISTRYFFCLLCFAKHRNRWIALTIFLNTIWFWNHIRKYASSLSNVQLFLPNAYWKIIGNSAIFCASSSTAAVIFLDRFFVLSMYTLRVHAFKTKLLPEQFFFSTLKFQKCLRSRAPFNSLLACFDLWCMTNTPVSFEYIITSSAFCYALFFCLVPQHFQIFFNSVLGTPNQSLIHVFLEAFLCLYLKPTLKLSCLWRSSC